MTRYPTDFESQTLDNEKGMGCVLRVSGDEFDVEDLLSQLSLVPVHLRRKGQPLFAKSSSVAEYTGFNIVTSEASESDFPAQIRDAVAYLKCHSEEIIRVIAYPGVTGAVLDFAIERRDVVVQNDYLPPELLLVAGKLGLGINLSQYPPRDSNP